jgi:hypothetical protein
VVTQSLAWHKESLLQTLYVFFNLALTTFSFNRNIDNDNWLVFLLRSLCVYCPVGSESLHITFKIRHLLSVPFHQYFMAFFVLVLILSEGQTGEAWKIKKSLSDIGELSTQQYFSRFFKQPVLRHCPDNEKLSCWKETIKILFLYTRIHRYVHTPTRSPLGSVRKIVKMRKSTVSYIMSVRFSVCPHWTRPHSADFHEIRYLNIFRKSAEKIQLSLKYDNNYVYFTSRYMQTYNIWLDYF